MASIHGGLSSLTVFSLFSLISLTSPASSSSLYSPYSHRRCLLQSITPPPRNLQTTFPSLPSPAFRTPPSPPTPTTTTTPSPSSSSSPSLNKYNRNTIIKAVAVTAVVSFTLCAILMGALYCYYTKRLIRIRVSDSHELPKATLSGGVIVDEEGLDVLYLRNLESGDRSWSGALVPAAAARVEDQESRMQERDAMFQGRQLLPLNSSARRYSGLSFSGIFPAAKPPIPPSSPPMVPGAESGNGARK